MKPKIKKYSQAQCDSFLTKIAKLLYPRCEGCGAPTQVAHHWKEKSHSSFLRYDFRNLIGLCNSCHVKIHNRFQGSITISYDLAEKIIKGRGGKKWKDALEKDQRKYVKTDWVYYNKQYARLSAMLDELESK